jgi:hypothetical protein
MSARRYLTVLFILAAGVVPVIIGASCPPPTTPIFTPTSTNTGGARVLPECEPGFVCVSIVNQACIPAEIALYTQNGFDLCVLVAGVCTYQFPDTPSPACCPSGISNPTGCACQRPGADVGELMLTRPEIFQPAQLFSIQGSTTTILQPGASLLQRIQCGNIKTMGVAVGLPGASLTTPQFQEGPKYRERLAAPAVRLPTDARCGGTIEFLVQDISRCADPVLSQFAITTTVSQ